jgi:hypothetical protein
VDRKAAEAAHELLQSHPRLYFYVCTNAYREQILRASRKPLAQPDGRHPDRPAAIPDVVLTSLGGRPSGEAVRHISALCQQHNAAVALAAPPAAQPAAAPTPRSRPGEPQGMEALRERARELREQKARAGAMPQRGGAPQVNGSPGPANRTPVKPDLSPPEPDSQESGERFSRHAVRLLGIIGNPAELNGKYPPMEKTEEDFLSEIDFMLRLTQSPSARLRDCAMYSCIVFDLRSPAGEAANRDPPAVRAATARLQQYVDWLAVAGDLDLALQVSRLVQPRSDWEFTRDWGEVGDLFETLVTDYFREHQLNAMRSLISAAMSVLTRQALRELAGPAPKAEKPTDGPFQATLERTPGAPTFVSLRNRSGRPLHNVLIVMHSQANPERVAQEARGYAVQGLVAEWFGLFPPEVSEQMPGMIETWSMHQMLDQGGIYFLPEVPTAGKVRVAICTEDRLRLLEDISVEIWTDEESVSEVRPSNLERILREAQQAAATPAPAATGRPFQLPLPGVANRSQMSPQDAARARQVDENRRKQQAIQALNSARRAFAQRNEQLGVTYLKQAIAASPDSAAGKAAQRMLEQRESDEN